MKVNMLRNPSAEFVCPLKEGETGAVADAIGQKLVRLGLAVEVVEPLHAVPPRPAIAEAKPIEGTVEHAEVKLKEYKAKASREVKPSPSKKES